MNSFAIRYWKSSMMITLDFALRMALMMAGALSVTTVRAAHALAPENGRRLGMHWISAQSDATRWRKDADLPLPDSPRIRMPVLIPYPPIRPRDPARAARRHTHQHSPERFPSGE